MSSLPWFSNLGAMLLSKLCFMSKIGNITTIILFQWENIVHVPTNQLQLNFDSVYCTPNLYPVISKSCDSTSISLIFATSGEGVAGIPISALKTFIWSIIKVPDGVLLHVLIQG